jgi:hypothetical protein
LFLNINHAKHLNFFLQLNYVEITAALQIFLLF